MGNFSLSSIPSGGAIAKGTYVMKVTDVEPAIGDGDRSDQLAYKLAVAQDANGVTAGRKVNFWRTVSDKALWKIREDILAVEPSASERGDFNDPYQNLREFAKDVKGILVGKLVKIDVTERPNKENPAKPWVDYKILGRFGFTEGALASTGTDGPESSGSGYDSGYNNV